MLVHNVLKWYMVKWVQTCNKWYISSSDYIQEWFVSNGCNHALGGIYKAVHAYCKCFFLKWYNHTIRGISQAVHVYCKWFISNGYNHTLSGISQAVHVYCKCFLQMVQPYTK